MNPLFFKYKWLFFISMAIINGLILKFRSRKHIQNNPDLAPGYDQLFKGWLFFGSLPWIILFIAEQTGNFNENSHLLNLRSMDPVVWIFNASVLIPYAFLVRWVWFKSGAEFLVKHPGLLSKRNLSLGTYPSGKEIKIITPIVLVLYLVFLVLIWFNQELTK